MINQGVLRFRDPEITHGPQPLPWDYFLLARHTPPIRKVPLKSLPPMPLASTVRPSAYGRSGRFAR